MAELLEYLIQLRGAEVSAAEVKGLARNFQELGASAREAGVASETGGKSHGNAAAAAGGMGAAMKKMASVGALGLVGLAVATTKMSNTFNHEMLRVQTETGGTAKELNRMSTSVLNLAKSGATMGQGPDALAAGLYHLESLGIRGSKALMALKLASQEAAISGASLEDVTSALGSVLYVGIKGATNLKSIMEQLNATVGSGNMRMQQLVEAMGTGVLSSAKIAGLSFQDVTAALAVFSDSGQAASSAAAQFATALHYLYAPTDKATKALASIGIAQSQLAADMHKPNGMVTALGDLRDHLKGLSQIKAAQVLNDILPGGRGRILLTELNMMPRAVGKYRQQRNIMGEFSSSVAAQRKDPTTRLKTSAASVAASMIELGNAFTKYVTPAAAAFMSVLGSLLGALLSAFQWFVKMSPAAKAVATFLGALVAGFVAYKAAVIAATIVQGIFTAASTIGAFVALLGSVRSLKDMWILLDMAMDANPIALVVVAIAALAAGFVYAYQKSKTFRDIVNGVFSWLKTAASGTVKWVVNAFGNFVSFFAKLPGRIGGFFTGAWDGIKKGFVDILNWIINKLNWFIGAYNSVVGKIPFAGSHLKIGLLGTIGTGGGTSGAGLTKGKGSVASAGADSSVWARKGTMTASSGAFTSPAKTSKNGKAPLVVNGDLVIKVKEHEIGRIQRRELQKAMMG